MGNTLHKHDWFDKQGRQKMGKKMSTWNEKKQRHFKCKTVNSIFNDNDDVRGDVEDDEKELTKSVNRLVGKFGLIIKLIKDWNLFDKENQTLCRLKD